MLCVRPKNAGYQRVSHNSNVVMYTVFVFNVIKNIESLRDERNMLGMAIFTQFNTFGSLLKFIVRGRDRLYA